MVLEGIPRGGEQEQPVITYRVLSQPMFQADPFVGTILFKTHHNSVRSLLPGPLFTEKMKAQRGEGSDWWTLSAMAVPSRGPAVARAHSE